jgi:hypothetical protein
LNILEEKMIKVLIKNANCLENLSQTQVERISSMLNDNNYSFTIENQTETYSIKNIKKER